MSAEKGTASTLSWRRGRELIVTLALLPGAVFLAGAYPTEVAALTPAELGIVVVLVLAFAAGSFAAMLYWLSDARGYLPLLLVTTIACALLGGLVTERMRGPACLSEEINDPSLCKAPPPGIHDLSAWWTGWSAAEANFIMGSVVGAGLGGLVKLEILKSGRLGARH